MTNVSRKEARKAARKLKNAKRFAFASKKSLVEVLVSSGSVKERKKRKKSRKSKKKTPVEPGTDPAEQAKVAAIRRREQRALIKQEEADAKRFAKKLGLNKRRSKSTLPRSFVDAGLDYILDVCNRKKPGNVERDGAEQEQRDVGEDSGAEDSMEETAADAWEYNDDEDLVMEEWEEGESSETKPLATTDIYGRVLDSEGRVIELSSNNTRMGALEKLNQLEEARTDSGDWERDRLKKQIRGFVNRLSERTLVSTTSQMEDLYQRKSRNEVKEILSDTVLQALTVHYQLPVRLSVEYSAFLSLVHSNVSSEISGHFVETVACKLRDYIISEKIEQDDKTCTNLATVMADLFRFKVISGRFVKELLEFLVEKFSEHAIELVILLLTNIGFLLRKTDPAGLKEIIFSIHRKVGAREKEEESSRVRFMLETLMAIKNNNAFKLDKQGEDSVHEHFLKLLRALRKGSESALPFGFRDVLEAEEKGRWWIVGSAWVSGAKMEKEDTDTHGRVMEDSVVSGQVEFSDRLLKLARKYRMNTELRRTIFCVLLSGEDYLEAFEKLLKLGLKDQQEREIVHICITCCLAEKSFNPYYSLLLKKFCKFHRRFQLTSQFAVWDRMKEVQNLKWKQRSNLAKLIGDLVSGGALNLSVLKVIDFARLDAETSDLLKEILVPFLTENSVEDLRTAFGKLTKMKDQKLFMDGLNLYFSHVLRNVRDVPEDKYKLLIERLDILEKIFVTETF